MNDRDHRADRHHDRTDAQLELIFGHDELELGTWLFLLGSIQMTIRPAIRLARRTHLRRRGSAQPAHPMDF